MTTDVFFGSQAEREKQYDARSSVADFPGYMQAYADRAREVAASHLARIDIAYGPASAQRLDIFAPSGAACAPVFMFIHGGYWRALRKEDMYGIAPELVKAGIAVVFVEYTLAPEATLAQIVGEMQAAVAWLYAHGRAHGLDPDRLYVGGSSAGGHLAAMLMTLGWPARNGLPDDVIKGGVALSGLFDLRPLIDTVVNSWLHLSEAEAWSLSPAAHPPQTTGEMVLSVGGKETLGFKQQTCVLEKQWRLAGLPVVRVDMPDADHFNIVFALADEASPLFQATRDLILRK